MPTIALTLAPLLTLGLTPSSSAAAVPHFTDITAAAGINVQGLGNASSWIDYDADGDLDLFATNSDFSSRVYLLRNDGDGTFTDVTAGAGFGGASFRSVAWGDFGNDGWPDLAATTYFAGDSAQLYHNDGDGTFTKIGPSAGLTRQAVGISWRVSWADYDRDGHLDLYQANLGRDFLYRGNGDGTFTEVGQAAGVSDTASSQDASWGDFDHDGWPDLFVSNDGADRLYRNQQDGTFADVTVAARVGDRDDTSRACWGDYDADGRLDLYLVDIGTIRNRLYHNRGDGTFEEVARQLGVADVGDGRTCNWVDADADGRLDLFAANHVHDNRLYRQSATGRFSDVAQAAGIAKPFDTFNGAWGDADGDGDLDLFAVGHANNVLYRNDGPVGGHVALDLVGTASNRSAIGARLTLPAPGKRSTREVQGSTGAYGQDSLTVEFGVGAAPGPFSIRIEWPAGGVQTVTVFRDTRTQVVEP